MTKESELIEIMKYGTSEQIQKARDTINGIVIQTGDLNTASKLMTEFPGIFTYQLDNQNNIMALTADNFFNNLSITLPDQAKNSLVEVITDKNTRSIDKAIAIEKFPLFAMLHLYHTVVDYDNAPDNYSFNEIPEFKEIVAVFHLVEAAIKLETEYVNYSFNNFPKDIRLGLEMGAYLDFVMNGKSLLHEIAERNPLKKLKAPIESFMPHINTAKAGYVVSLERDKANTNDELTKKIIDALLPYAALVQVRTLTKKKFADVYSVTTEYEKTSESFVAFEKFAPILTLEKIRREIVEDKYTKGSEKIRDIAKNAHECVAPFANEVLTTYINKICATHKID
jgi:hypothetical protein